MNTINASTNSINFSISVENQTSTPKPVEGAFVVFPIQNPVYQYIQINDSVLGSQASLDSYISNVVYTFSIPASWVQNHSINPHAIRLLKFKNHAWLSQPTTYMGQSGNSYVYSAQSDSLSTYAVSYTSQNATSARSGSTTATISLNMIHGFETYFWVAVAEINVNGQNWTSLSEPVSGYSINGGGQGGKANATDIGYNAIYSTGTISSNVDPSASGLTATILEGMGANVIFQNGAYNAINVNGIKSSPQTLSYTVATTNSFVILTLGMNDGGNSAEPTPTASWPAGCTPIQNITGDYGRLASLVACPSQAAGAYSVTVTFGSSQGAGIGLVAYKFPPYALTLDDANPSTGTISTDGYSALATGSVINVIGTGQVTANPPSGDILNNWTASNSNITILNALSNPTDITVMGNGILTANYVAATITSSFTESGLPSGTAWNMTYRDFLGTGTGTPTTNTITFKTNAGNFVYSIPNQTVGTTVYQPRPSSGYVIAGNTVTITFGAQPTLTMQLNPTFYRVSDNITANAALPTDGIEILANGIVKSSSTGNTIFNANTLLAGSYNITGKDTTSDTQTTQILTIEPDPSQVANVVPITLEFPNVTISASETLTSDIFCNSLKINAGVTVTTNGYSILCINNFTNDGTIITGNVPNGGTGIASSTGNPGGNVTGSFGGSGAGGGGNDKGSTKNGAGGGSTQAAGGAGGGFNGAGANGGTPASPSVSASNIVTWYNGGVQNFLEAAGGGAGGGVGGGTKSLGGNGGGGGKGIFIQARNIFAGNIIAVGLAGRAGGTSAGGGGGGGGGSVILVYKDTLNDSKVNVTGGSGGPACAGCGNPGGAGGSGQIITYTYVSVSGPIPIIPSPWQQLVPVNSLEYQPSEASALDNIDFFYVNGTVIPSWLEANALNTAANSLYWLKFPDAFFGEGRITVYMGFAATNINRFNLTDGEAPQLSATYGQYDSGANVFLAYANGTDNSLLNLSEDALTSQAAVTLTSGSSGPAIAMSTAASSNVIQWAGFKLGLTRYILNGFIYPTQTSHITGLGGETELTPQGYIFGAGSGAAGTLASISKALTTAITTLASGGTASANAWKYLQAIYNNGAMNATVGTAVLQKTQSVTATDTSFTGNSVGIAVSDTTAGSNLAYYEYFYAHSYPMGGKQPSVTFGNMEFIPPSVSATCTISLSNSLVDFGSIAPTSNSATSNLVVDTDSGTAASNILVEGGNWISGSSNFYVANTLWNPTSSASYIGNAVQLIPSLADTKIKINAGGNGDIYFGAGVPAGQPSGSYSQNIILENLC